MRLATLLLALAATITMGCASRGPGADAPLSRACAVPKVPSGGGASASGGVDQVQAPNLGDKVPIEARSAVHGGSGQFSADDSSKEARYQATGGNQNQALLNYFPTGAAAGGGKGGATHAELKLGESLDACRREQSECQDPDRKRELDVKERDLLDRLSTASAAPRISIKNVFNLDGAKSQNLGLSTSKGATPESPEANAKAFVAGAAAVEASNREVMSEYESAGVPPPPPIPAPAAPDAPDAPGSGEDGE